MRTLNLGILAHVDAGKTSLTERLLHAAGVIDEIGSVDNGSTQTDSLELERQRGITIRSAVVSFRLGDLTVNLIDTPGHPDFIAEVERVLNVLDGVVLVISAVEGVQPQTHVLYRALQRLRIPTLFYVNKVDRGGARYEETLDAIAERLTPSILAMGRVRDVGTRGASFVPFAPDNEAFTAARLDVVASTDERLLTDYVADPSAVSERRLRRAFRRGVAQASVHPVYFGSAITGTGIGALSEGIREWLPHAPTDLEAPLAGTVFKVERESGGAKVAYARLFSGVAAVREPVSFAGTGEGKVTAIETFESGATQRVNSAAAGEIVKVWGLEGVRVGDALAAARGASDDGVADQGLPGGGSAGGHHFAPPTLEAVVVPADPDDRGPLFLALTQLAEQDPLIRLRQDDASAELAVSLYGEVQKEVIQATLAADFGLDVEFRESTTIYVERPLGPGAAVDFKRAGGNPFLATVGLEVAPSEAGGGVQFRLASHVLGTMPLAFFKAVEDTVHETLRQGLYGWQVTDCAVVMTHTGYFPRQSHAHQRFSKSMSSTGEDFRKLTPLVLMDALREAGTAVLEPIARFRLEIPAVTLGGVLPVLARLIAAPLTPEARGPAYVIEGDIPAARIHELQQLLPDLTSGEGVLEHEFSRYAPVSGEPPRRPRTDHNPLDRKEYLLHVQRRV